jgi:hypothetical protein
MEVESVWVGGGGGGRFEGCSRKSKSRLRSALLVLCYCLVSSDDFLLTLNDSLVGDGRFIQLHNSEEVAKSRSRGV